jgi:hypothetical protein
LDRIESGFKSLAALVALDLCNGQNRRIEVRLITSYSRSDLSAF